MSLKRFCYGAKIEKVIDGDTVDLIVDLMLIAAVFLLNTNCDF